jgi:site-specific recombinase XerD
VLTVSLRDLMRFLHFRGLIPESCIAAVPRPAPWPRRALPDTIEKPELNAFLRSFDRSTATGRRDYAMALCLTQMGMRVQEVAAVTVEDLDGRQHAVRLRRTKVRRDRLLPLDQRTTGALLQYLQNGRPYTSSSALFVRHRAPLGQALQAHHVRGAMIRALARSGLQTTRVHIFRHAFATRLHRRGIGLKAIADWLGHLNLNTTAQYARVNLEELKQAALPWPEEWR